MGAWLAAAGARLAQQQAPVPAQARTVVVTREPFETPAVARKDTARGALQGHASGTDVDALPAAGDPEAARGETSSRRELPNDFPPPGKRTPPAAQRLPQRPATGRTR